MTAIRAAMFMENGVPMLITTNKTQTEKNKKPAAIIEKWTLDNGRKFKLLRVFYGPDYDDSLIGNLILFELYTDEENEYADGISCRGRIWITPHTIGRVTIAYALSIRNVSCHDDSIKWLQAMIMTEESSVIIRIDRQEGREFLSNIIYDK